MEGRLDTGIDVLDRKLDGGIPPGSIIAFTASPASQSELLLYQLTAARGSLYLTTQRSDQAVRDAIEATSAPTGSPTVRDISGSEPLDQANRLIRALPEGANLIIDPVDVLERRERSRYRNFLNDLQNHMVNTGSLAILHCLDGDSPPDNRDTTQHMADIVFDLTTTVRGTDVENRLSVPKFRGGQALTETIKLEMQDQVDIDTSRDIA
ncbi:RecA-superfamily ATPase, KaiC/GvpD/RAD55 family [Natronoarchaeum philippinense]|uniref:RecA-superfamily ATPase, KaiC/GvpD/RAD55 family n=1 Tax=Natronoarchaeum philippinense TaxID=558529 RepID=A0A285NEA4_NATPI|nr:transcriptional regulator [Natronoarchaeum philippinense]SNZ06256.1 RecA-superfamily ATPase, KaiC/GvpD/RAD55 family [Natronoarchaeum philippinense]